MSRISMAPQVKELLEATNNYQTSASSGSFDHEDLQATCNKFVEATRQLAKYLELPLLNDKGLSRGYARCLQTSATVNCMKDVIDSSIEHKLGPRESMEMYIDLAKVQASSSTSSTSAPPNVNGDAGAGVAGASNGGNEGSENLHTLSDNGRDEGNGNLQTLPDNRIGEAENNTIISGNHLNNMHPNKSGLDDCPYSEEQFMQFMRKSAQPTSGD